jgi:hypothetical protein
MTVTAAAPWLASEVRFAAVAPSSCHGFVQTTILPAGGPYALPWQLEHDASATFRPGPGPGASMCGPRKRRGFALCGPLARHTTGTVRLTALRLPCACQRSAFGASCFAVSMAVSRPGPGPDFRVQCRVCIPLQFCSLLSLRLSARCQCLPAKSTS